MNFLSHYYLHRDYDDNYFTVGLTVPDILGFHTNRVRVTEKNLLSLKDRQDNKNLISSINGMLMHLKVDSWFHGSQFFKEKILFLKNFYKEITGHDDLPHHLVHILLEILIDRYLLEIEPIIADDFYDSYKKFNFDSLTEIFKDLRNFDKQKFLDLTESISNSSFLKEYKNNYAIIDILKRVSKRIGYSLNLNPSNNSLANFFDSSYKNLELSIKNLFSEAKNTLSLTSTYSINISN